MKKQVYLILCCSIIAVIGLFYAGCMVEKPNPCDCAFNDTYANSKHWDESLSKKCDRYANSLNNADRRVWESEKQNCIAAAGK